MINDLRVQGEVAAGFEGLREEFGRNFTERGDVGASFAVYRDGVPVVDLWAGVADPATGRPWRADTVALVHSVTKGATSVLVHRLVADGLLDLDAPVAEYWPEFAAAGKQHVTVAQLLSHQAGLHLLETPLSRRRLLAGHPAALALARQAPAWPPGTRHGYHAMTIGWLTGELVARVCGRPLGCEFAERIARPLHLDLWIGLPREYLGRVAPLIDGIPDPGDLARLRDPQEREQFQRVAEAARDPRSTYSRAFSTNGALPVPSADTWNDPDLWTAELPAVNGITNARALARMYAATVGPVDGVRILPADVVDRARTEQLRGPDETLLKEKRYALGFELPLPGDAALTEESFGHGGGGGALGFGDVGARVGFGYVMNQMGASQRARQRAVKLVEALRQALG